MYVAEPQLFAGGDFAAHINFRGGVIAHKHSGEARTNPHGCQFRDFLFQLAVNLIANRAAV